MPAAIKTDLSGRSRMYCSQTHATPWSLSAPLLVVFRGLFTRLFELRLGGVPDGPSHFLKIFSHFFRLLAKLITCGRHRSSS